MKNIIFIFCLISLLIFCFYCKEDKGTTPQVVYVTTNTGTSTGTNSGTNTGTTSGTNTGSTTGTTYQVKNSSSYTLEDVCSYYWDGSQTQDFVSHGDLSVGQTTSKVTTNRNVINLGLTIGGQTCIITDDYYITNNTNNILSITDTSGVYCGKNAKKTIKYYFDICK